MVGENASENIPEIDQNILCIVVVRYGPIIEGLKMRASRLSHPWPDV